MTNIFTPEIERIIETAATAGDYGYRGVARTTVVLLQGAGLLLPKGVSRFDPGHPPSPANITKRGK